MKLRELFGPVPPQPPDLTEKEHMERWQCQPLIRRLWRLRWYLMIPLSFLQYWFHQQRVKRPDTDNRYLWDMAVGDAQIEMRYWYSMDETMKYLQTERALRNGTIKSPKEGR